jgi:hypothetical protein
MLKKLKLKYRMLKKDMLYDLSDSDAGEKMEKEYF